jgi:hypothetical protein
VIAVSTEGSVARPGFAIGQLAAIVDVAPLKPSDGTGSPYIVADSHVDCLICFSSHYAAFELV